MPEDGSKGKRVGASNGGFGAIAYGIFLHSVESLPP
jgi:hypothetical protein